MIKVIADNPEQQDLADYLEEIAQPYIKLVTQARFDSLVDGRARAVKVEVINDEVVCSIIFPDEPNEMEIIKAMNFAYDNFGSTDNLIDINEE